jgi:hypothetical protein
MQTIYKTAFKTLIWLGMDMASQQQRVPNLEQAFSVISRFGNSILERLQMPPSRLREIADLRQLFKGRRDLISLDALAVGEIDALRCLFERDWLVRLWVIQEFNSSLRAEMHFGDARRLTPVQDAQVAALVANWIFNDGMFFNRNFQGPAREGLIAFARMRRAVFSGRPGSDGLHVFNVASLYKASDPRDRIFAVFGMLGMGEWMPPSLFRVDYTLSKSEVYLRFAAATVEHSRNLKILSFVLHSPGALSSPSWVPQWDGRNRAGNRVIGQHDSHWNACCQRYSLAGGMADHDDDWRPEHQGRLHAEGVVIGIITRELAVWSTHTNLLGLDPHQRWRESSTSGYLAAWGAVYAQTNTTKSTRSRLTALAMTLSCGYTENRRLKKRSEIHQRFLEFLALLRHLCGGSEGFLEAVAEVETPQLSMPRLNALSYHMTLLFQNRKLVKTSEGDLAMGPDTLEVGDEACILFGGRVPFILRPDPNRSSHRLVGEAYVHQLMDGEAIQLWEDKNLELNPLPRMFVIR